MKQSRMMSMLETTLSTAAGFGLSLLLQWLVLSWMVGVPIALQTNLAFAAVMTGASLVRGFVLRRVFEAFHIRRPLTPFMNAVLHECFRQRDAEGWTPEHDDKHNRGELARAGACYITHAGTESSTMPHEWPWNVDWWKPHGYRRDMVRGVALSIAEGDRFDRMRKAGSR